VPSRCPRGSSTGVVEQMTRQTTGVKWSVFPLAFGLRCPSTTLSVFATVLYGMIWCSHCQSVHNLSKCFRVSWLVVTGLALSICVFGLFWNRRALLSIVLLSATRAGMIASHSGGVAGFETAQEIQDQPPCSRKVHCDETLGTSTRTTTKSCYRLCGSVESKSA
jgi:hypothetical protein